MRMIGIGIFRTAIGLLGTFDNEKDFRRIIDFRDYFYSNQNLTEIGLKRTRPFIGHLTLSYIERDIDSSARQKLVECIVALNEQIKTQSIIVELPHARLHKYADLSAFHTFDNFPAATL